MVADDAPRVFALGGSRDFGRGVAARLNVPLSEHEERDFEDGEHKARPLVSVRNRDVFVIHSLYGDDTQSANDKLCRLLFFCAACRDAAAASVTAVAPYLCYARKDRKTKARDPVTTRYVAAMFEAVGVERVMALEVHNQAAFQNAFRCATEHLDARRLFVEPLRPLIENDDLVVVSPDSGGMKRAEAFRKTLAGALDLDIASAMMEKYRSRGQVSGEMLVGDFAGRTALIVDDLIASGGTMLRTARKAREQGAARVLALATHGLFVGEANKVFADDAIERLVITNSVPAFRLSNDTARSKLLTVDAAPLVGEAIARIRSGGSLVDLLGIEA
ncbi:ribose-phosphate diphosphokinase [Ferruginivarius sediminum]|uniref:ribose-phosphate diphosphokinase n=1 Tax=Ferruginivarius sediminum TaxID=2661937 RepID=A0A369T5G9_9PROT|nr:ribose-phosphate diphosphokinase [Ferruginivarius sediminum]RDD60581.1 ribose-phosphate pyrophosphokinase [Ferruginivarius sediminum]